MWPVSISLLFPNYFVEDIISHIKKTGKKILEDVLLIDIYSDENIGKDNINYTFRLIYRDIAKTLKDSDIQETHIKLLKSVESKYSSKQRV